MWWHTRRNHISSLGRKGRVHLNRLGGVSSVDYWQPRCAPSAVVMLDTPCSEVVWRVLATHCIRQFPFHFPSRASPCAITFQLESNAQYLGAFCFIHLDSLACCSRQQLARDVRSSAQFARNPNVNTENSAFNVKHSHMCNYCHNHHNKYQFTAN